MLFGDFAGGRHPVPRNTPDIGRGQGRYELRGDRLPVRGLRDSWFHHITLSPRRVWHAYRTKEYAPVSHGVKWQTQPRVSMAQNGILRAIQGGRRWLN